MSTILKADANGAVILPADLCRLAGVEPEAELVADVQTGRIVLERPRPSLAEQITELARDLPQEVVDQLPTDGAAEHDHYLYGSPKRHP